jgi:hypothetical protein
MWEGIGSAISGFLGYKGQKDTNVASAQQAQKQMDFQREMSNTAVQRRMADLKKAGINPILAGSKEASSPAGQQAPVGNKMQAALANATSAANIKNIQANTKLANTKANALAPAGTAGSTFDDMLNSIITAISADQENTSSAKDSSTKQTEIPFHAGELNTITKTHLSDKDKKFKETLLQDKVFLDKVKKLWKEIKQEHPSPWQLN